MALSQKLLTDLRPAKPEPIQYLTENGFRIIRLSDIDQSVPKAGIEHDFIVHDPDGYELDIAVSFNTRVAAEVIQRSCERVNFESSFWICAAERHLADYLWEHNDYPPDANFTVDELTLDDMDLAQRWESPNPIPASLEHLDEEFWEIRKWGATN